MIGYQISSVNQVALNDRLPISSINQVALNDRLPISSVNQVALNDRLSNPFSKSSNSK